MEAGLFLREIGEGHPIVVLHGGPDFGHTDLLPSSTSLPTRTGSSARTLLCSGGDDVRHAIDELVA